MEYNYNEIVATVLRTGGITINGKGEQPTTGYVVALGSEHSQIWHFQDLGNRATYASALRKFIGDNENALGQKDHFLGIWEDNATGEIYFDVVEVVECEYAATLLGEIRNQISIYHLDTGKTIETGGNGR
jgi:hypothetical protein